METMVDVVNVTKTYGKEYALHDVSMRLEKGNIYGLVGKNGAGKTTLMRVLAGLCHVDQGEVHLFSSQSEQENQQMRKQIGCMIEHPCIIEQLSAQENLTFHKLQRGIKETGIEDRLLELVKLADCGKKHAGSFSLGMKQRLGIAISLLAHPSLLILDEPINGLDPVGVVEIRTLLLDLCKKEQITILISSHNLFELYQIATAYFIMREGRILSTFTLQELEAKEMDEEALEAYVLSMIGGVDHA